MNFTEPFMHLYRTWRLEPALSFLLHQFVAQYGVPYTAPLVFGLGFKLLYLLGQQYSNRDFYAIISDRSFPVQVLLALIMGSLIGCSVKHRAALWVWVFPLAILGYAFVFFPLPLTERTSIFDQGISGQARLSHFFGSGCQPRSRCFDQVLVTMPFYSCLTYSFGAFLARRLANRHQLSNQRLSFALFGAGAIILLAVILDLIISIQNSGWHMLYLLIVVTPIGVAFFVLYLASMTRRRAIPSP